MEQLDSTYSVEQIETKVMSVLYANIDKKFSQFSLFNKLIRDKFTELENKPIHPTIKARFLLILRNLPSRFDDIIVTKTENVFYVVCISSPDAPIQIYEPEIIINKTTSVPNTNTNTNTNTGYFGFGAGSNAYNKTTNVVSNDNSVNSVNSLNYVENALDYSLFLDYIIDNNLTEFINYVDGIDGNTISHDLVSTSNTKKIKQFIDSNKFQFFVLNRHEKAPYQLTQTKEVSDILLNALATKYQLETKLNETEIEANKKTIGELRDKVILSESYTFKEDIIIDFSIGEILLIKINNKLRNINLEYFYVAILAIMAYFILFK